MHHDLADGILAKARVRGSSYMWRPEAWENSDSKTHMIIACSYQNELIPTVPDSSSWNSIHWFVRINLYDLYRLYLSTDQHYLPSGLNDSHTTLATVRFSSIQSGHLLFSWPFPLRCPEFATEHGPCFSLLKDKVIISWWGWKNQVATVLQKNALHLCFLNLKGTSTVSRNVSWKSTRYAYVWWSQDRNLPGGNECPRMLVFLLQYDLCEDRDRMDADQRMGGFWWVSPGLEYEQAPESTQWRQQKPWPSMGLNGCPGQGCWCGKPKGDRG